MSYARTSLVSANTGLAMLDPANKERGGKRMPTTPRTAQPKRMWSDEQRQTVKALLAKGATASVVAREMGIGRNQALGRIYRDPELALSGFSKRQRLNRSTRPPQGSTTPRNAATVAAAGNSAAPAKPEPPNSSTNPMALIGTGLRWCKWPVTMDSRVLGGFLCCGARSLPHDVYCQYHHDLAKRPLRARP